jgi:PAS domain S-box-containing protein
MRNFILTIDYFVKRVVFSFLIIEMDNQPPGKSTLTQVSPPAAIDEQFMLMANTARVLLWVADANKLRYFFNKCWLEFTGNSLEEESGNGWVKGIHPEDLERCMKTYTEAIANQEEFKMEYRLRHHDGKYHWILDNGTPHFIKDKTFGGYIGSCVDINDLKELELRKDQFITAASHELKTPVTSLSVYLHFISEFLKKSHEEKFAGYAENAINQVNKITGLIYQLLDLSKIQTDSLNFDWTVFAFCELVTSTVEKIQSITSSHEIEIKGSCKGLVEGDKERLSQALENLLNNALKYSKEKNKIEVHLSEDTKSVKVSVIDFGIGIDTEYFPKVFDRFYKIPGEKEETFPGLGIGLFISDQIIKKHGGKISVESNPGKETKFNFEIPVFNQTI